MNSKTVTLSEVADGGIFTDGDWVESKDQDATGTVRLIQLADVGVGAFRDRSDRWMREDQAERLNCTFLQAGDILIARMPEPIGRACIVPSNIGRAVTAVDVAVLRVRDSDILPAYVMWMINSPDFHARVSKLQSGTTRKRISRKNLAGLTIPALPLMEQRRIVDILQGHLSCLDVATEGIELSRRRLKGLREHSILRAVTGVDVDGARHGQGPADLGAHDGDLADLPAGWTWARLGEVAEVVGGVTKDASKQSNPSYAEVPYLRVANVQRGALNLSSITTIRVPPAKADALTLRAGDVLLNEGGDRDKLARGWVWEGQIENCIHQNHVFRARVRDGIVDPYFLSWTANTLGGRWAERNAKQSVNLASISLSTIRKMPVIVPPRSVGAETVARLHSSLESFDRLDVGLRVVTHRARALRGALLRAAFSGRLTGRLTDRDLIEELADA